MLTLLFVLIALALYFWSQKNSYIMHWKLNGEFGLPFLGVIFEMSNPYKLLGYLGKLEQNYKSPYVLWMGPNCVVVSSDPDTMESIFTSPHCVNKSFIYEFLTDFIGDGLFSSNAPMWYSRVKQMKPAFKRKIILSFYSIFNRSTCELLDNIEANKNNDDYNFYHAIQLNALQSTFQTTLGIKYTEANCFDFEEMLNIYSLVMGAMIDRIFKPWYYDPRIYKCSENYNNSMTHLKPYIMYLDKQIEEKAKAFEAEKLKNINNNAILDDEDKPYTAPESFIDFMFNNNTTMSPVNMRDEIIVLIGAGFETTAVALYITILCLSMHPEEQERLFNELALVFPHKDFDISEENVKSDLTYTEMCISESLRVISPTPVVGRTNTKDLTLKDGTVIKKDTNFILDIFNMQRSTRHWGPEAKKFNPENFHPENLKNHHPYAYVPFTKGHRMCIGFKYSFTFMKMFLARLFRNYKITADMKFEDLEFVENISMKIKRHPKFKFEKREL